MHFETHAIHSRLPILHFARLPIFVATLAAIAASALPLACTPADSPAPATPPGDTTSLGPSSTPDSNTTSTRSKAPLPCTANQLSVASVFKEAGAGNRALVFAFTNEGEATCTVKGYPGITPVDSTGNPVPGVDIAETENTYFQAARAAEEVRLAPGERASFMVSFGAVETEGETCVDAAGLDISPPGASDSLRVQEPLYRICTGELRVTPIISGIPQL